MIIFDLQEIYSNPPSCGTGTHAVVNCLRSLTYKRFIPTFKKRVLDPASCELLTIFDIQEIYSNISKTIEDARMVVNCLRSLTYKRFIPTVLLSVYKATVL